MNGSIKGGTFSAQASNLKSKALMREVLEPKGVRPRALGQLSWRLHQGAWIAISRFNKE